MQELLANPLFAVAVLTPLLYIVLKRLPLESRAWVINGLLIIFIFESYSVYTANVIYLDVFPFMMDAGEKVKAIMPIGILVAGAALMANLDNRRIAKVLE